MLGSDVEAQIKEVEGLRLVGGAAGFAALRKGDKLTLPPQTPAAYVIVLREQPEGDLRDTNLSVLQLVTYHLAIISVVAVANDRLGELTNAASDQVRRGIRDKVFGWTPPGFDLPFIRGPSVLFDFVSGAHWHQDEFITQRYEEPSNGES